MFIIKAIEVYYLLTRKLIEPRITNKHYFIVDSEKKFEEFRKDKQDFYMKKYKDLGYQVYDDDGKPLIKIDFVFQEKSNRKKKKDDNIV
jgi:hypothetical protein